MSYIGKTPTVGNFIKLDAITTSATNSYTLQHNSVNFSPESANHMLVSLNGVIQAPNTSFSVSGSTITFLPSSGTLSSSDVIDFIMVYGNVLDVGVATTVSDASITKAKMNLISDSSSAGLTIKGDGGSENGTLQLNCSQNSHGVKLSSPAHSSGQSYEMVLPTTNITAGKFLKVDSVSGSGATGIGQLSFADAGGITEADSFRLQSTQAISSGTNTVLTGFAIDNESTFGKIGTGLSESSGVFTLGATGIYLLIANFYLRINGNLTYAGLKIQGTTNNSSYVNMAYNDHSIAQVVGNTYAGNTTHAIFDCQDTSNYKFRLQVYGTQGFDVIGSSGDSHTYVTAIRLGNT